MATLQDHWNEVSGDERFIDLPQEKKEKVRQRLWDQYVQTDSRYLGLPESKRIKVRQRFDEMTNIPVESTTDKLIRKGKKVVSEVAPVVKKAAEAVVPAAKKVGKALSEQVDTSKIGSTLEDIEASGVEIPGAKAAKKFVSEGFEAGAQMIEPSDEGYGRIGQEFGTVKSWNPVTQFEMARAAAAGGVRYVGDLLSGAIPETTLGAGAYFTPVDAFMKAAGVTFPFLAKERHLPDIHLPWAKPKPTGTPTIGNEMKSLIQRQVIENNGRMATDGPPRPLEHLAHEEAKVQAQAEYDQYQNHLLELEQKSYKEGKPIPLPGPEADLYPEAKANITQLRDAAKERLQKLQGEPVRTDSLSRSEDLLQEYYTRRIANARAYLDYAPGVVRAPPSSIELEEQKLLAGGPQPAGLLKPGKENIPEPLPAPETKPITPAPTRTSPGRPAQPKTPPPEQPTAAPVKPSEGAGKTFKQYLQEMIDYIHPDEPKQARRVTVGALMSSFREQGFLGSEELNPQSKSFIDAVIKEAQRQKIIKDSKVPIEEALPEAKYKQKGLDPLEIKAEAQRLKLEHDFNVKTANEARAELKFATGGIGFNDPDPMTGKIPEQEEVLRNVPDYLRGETKPDEAAKMAYDAGLIASPDINALFDYTRKFIDLERPRSTKSFLDEAEHNIESQMKSDAGFSLESQEAKTPKVKPKDQTLPDMPQAQFPDKFVTGYETSAEKAPEGTPNDLFGKSSFDLGWDLFDTLGEGGQVSLGGTGGNEIDPVKKARQQAIIKELTDRAMKIGYQTTEDVMLYIARNAPKELQDSMRKDIAPTLSAFDDHAYKEIDEAKKGNPVAQKSLADRAERSYLQKKAEMIKGTYKKFKANQQIALFKDGDEGVMKLESDFFIHDNFRKFSKDELAAQMFYQEGKAPSVESLTALGYSEEDAKRWVALSKNPTPQMVEAKKALQAREDEAYDLISQYYDEMGYVENHVTRRWERPEQYLDWEGKKLGNNPVFAKNRKFVTRAEGIEAGFKPVSMDIKDEIRAMDRTRTGILSRIHAWQKLGASMAPDGPAMINEAAEGAKNMARNAKLTPHTGQAPKSWIRIRGVPLLDGIAINPYYKEVAEYMLARPAKFLENEYINHAMALSKAAKLIGFFHGFTEGEMILSGINYRNVFSFNRDRNTMFRGLRYLAKAITADMEGETLSKNPVKAVGQLYQSFIRGHGALANRPLALTMAERNFKVGSVDADIHSILSRDLMSLEKMLDSKIKSAPIKGLASLPRHAVDVLNKSIFDYMRVIGSMLVYEDNLALAIKKFNIEAPAGQKMAIPEIERQIVAQVSNGMGGITYAQFMAHPSTQRALQWVMLAPEWTLGRPMMAGSTLLKGPQGMMARKQMAKLFIGWYTISNVMNYYNSKRLLGKGRWLKDNPEGYRDQVIRSKDEKGTTYYQLSKALTEIADYIHPAKTFVHKTSPAVQSAVKLMEWGASKSYYMNPYEKPVGPIDVLKAAYTPMFETGQSAYGGLPVRRGPSKTYIMEMLDRYYSGGEKDSKLYKRANQISDEQGFDFFTLDNMVRSAKSRQENKAMFK